MAAQCLKSTIANDQALTSPLTEVLELLNKEDKNFTVEGGVCYAVESAITNAFTAALPEGTQRV